MSLYREHGSGYLRPRINPAAERIGGALILAACLSWLGPTFLDAEDEMLVNLNAPAIEQGPLTAEELAAYRRAHECCSQDHVCNQGRGCPMRNAASAVSEYVETEPAGRQRDGWLTGLWLRFVRWAG